MATMKKRMQTALANTPSADSHPAYLTTRDEMNLVEIPFGPITASNRKTLEVDHRVYDRVLKREVARRTLITGSDAFGLPRPADDVVLVGMQALTYESGYRDRRVWFSRYQLCQILGWKPDGPTYKRLEESFDRIAGTTLKFKDSWWDKGEQEWKSKTFHLIEEVNLCSRDQLDRARSKLGGANHQLCSFVWGDVVWKSFEDGFIKSLDMQMFRRIARGRRREVPLRLFRILDKRFHKRSVVQFDVRRLCVGTLGLAENYSPSQMLRVLERAAKCLKDCGYLAEMQVTSKRSGRNAIVVFRKPVKPSRVCSKATTVNLGRLEKTASLLSLLGRDSEDDGHTNWIKRHTDEELLAWETRALEERYGTALERTMVLKERASGNSVSQSGFVRQGFVRRFMDERR